MQELMSRAPSRCSDRSGRDPQSQLERMRNPQRGWCRPAEEALCEGTGPEWPDAASDLHSWRAARQDFFPLMRRALRALRGVASEVSRDHARATVQRTLAGRIVASAGKTDGSSAKQSQLHNSPGLMQVQPLEHERRREPAQEGGDRRATSPSPPSLTHLLELVQQALSPSARDDTHQPVSGGRTPIASEAPLPTSTSLLGLSSQRRKAASTRWPPLGTDTAGCVCPDSPKRAGTSHIGTTNIGAATASAR